MVAMPIPGWRHHDTFPSKAVSSKSWHGGCNPLGVLWAKTAGLSEVETGFPTQGRDPTFSSGNAPCKYVTGLDCFHETKITNESSILLSNLS